MKFSILMPAYNDAKYIAESINSVLSQDYNEWELIIINDGSTDDTEAVIKSFSDERIKYINQENSDQLNAVIAGARQVTGDIIMLLHSDDLLADGNVLSYMNSYIVAHEDVDGLYSDYVKIDQASEAAGYIHTKNIDIDAIKSIMYSRGSNPVGDHFAVKREIFDSYIYKQYLIDNTIYFIDYENAGVINLKKIRPWYKYRVTDENYASNDAGKFVENNGRMRTIYKLLKNRYTIEPQIHNKIIYRLINKFSFYKLFRLIRRREIDLNYIYSYFYEWEKDLIVSGYPELTMLLIDKVLKSLEARKNNIGSMPLRLKYAGEKIYCGKDARIFYRDYFNGTINNFFIRFLSDEYDHIIVDDMDTYDAVMQAMNFYCLFYNVKVAA